MPGLAPAVAGSVGCMAEETGCGFADLGRFRGTPLGKLLLAGFGNWSPTSAAAVSGEGVKAGDELGRSLAAAVAGSVSCTADETDCGLADLGRFRGTPPGKLLLAGFGNWSSTSAATVSGEAGKAGDELGGALDTHCAQVHAGSTCTRNFCSRGRGRPQVLQGG